MKLRNKNTGEIVEYDSFGFRKGLSNGWNDFIPNADSLAELNAEWEDYAPKEPLIKDEKIRKAVRAWAEALDTDSCSFRADHDIFDFIAIGANCLRFDMSDGWGTYKLEDIPNGWHTIAELCGEEK